MTGPGGQGHRVFAAVYDKVMAPVEEAVLARRRAGLLAGLRGQVIEIGGRARG